MIQRNMSVVLRLKTLGQLSLQGMEAFSQSNRIFTVLLTNYT